MRDREIVAGACPRHWLVHTVQTRVQLRHAMGDEREASRLEGTSETGRGTGPEGSASQVQDGKCRSRRTVCARVSGSGCRKVRAARARGPEITLDPLCRAFSNAVRSLRRCSSSPWVPVLELIVEICASPVG